ncbi:hypothetical protein D9756_005923 [Leucocoprinus leucothites]|uniref:Uncharacterized protein n=1 Tax=Leucocoprinus leucothites TaxID=201217 RepID=A0A8H5D2D6_9AGAR|nr:hypothetical protein D9756_005923 [Leucoagaricus leucothites]
MSTIQDYLLFTTTRYDEGLAKFSWNNDENEPCPFLLCAHHHQRLVNATRVHKWPEAQKALVDYGKFKTLLAKVVENYKKSNNTDPKALRIRVALDPQGAFQTTCAPVPPFASDPTLLARGEPPTIPPGNLIEVRLDPAPTEPSVFTRTKTTKRAHYDDARARSGIPGLLTPQGPHFEALLFDMYNHVMESDIYNVAFYRGGRLPEVLA